MNILKTSSYSKNVENMLNSYGNEPILKIGIGRVALSKTTLFLLNVVSLGELNRKLKDSTYDKLFHLFMIIETSRGQFLLEKNEVISLSKKKIPPKSEIINITIPNGLTLNSILEKTKQIMRQDFFTYSGRDNNCQFFIYNILKSNHIITQENEKFVLQDTQQLFNGNPNFRKRLNTITDTGAIVNRVADVPSVRGLANDLLRNQYNNFTINNEMNKENSNPFKQFGVKY